MTAWITQQREHVSLILHSRSQLFIYITMKAPRKALFISRFKERMQGRASLGGDPTVNCLRLSQLSLAYLLPCRKCSIIKGWYSHGQQQKKNLSFPLLPLRIMSAEYILKTKASEAALKAESSSTGRWWRSGDFISLLQLKFLFWSLFLTSLYWRLLFIHVRVCWVVNALLMSC